MGLWWLAGEVLCAFLMLGREFGVARQELWLCMFSFFVFREVGGMGGEKIIPLYIKAMGYMILEDNQNCQSWCPGGGGKERVARCVWVTDN